ncbi:hypothetical protein O6H91_12G088800 [Diphasiastrum complanatum]|uniref:Uncharacterized protein n=2 Tax=Diphasiastrum complanatum TaxID=34168 RepID=A0ACC2C4P7_DIPCM|nr:hypothetical protein O6H91_12G075800 [Diphasiastrum complanatum]KAJ7536932.1 hypothetical protein O6H91_12G088800 [Diphasiastrum complanatum]
MMRTILITCMAASVFGIFMTFHIAAAQSLDPPAGNYVIRRVHGKGSQIYRCTTSNGEPTWASIAAKADLFPITFSATSLAERVGLHYFLPHPDSGGGKATWSSTSAPGANASTAPDSTVTGKVLVSIPSNNNSINSLLLEATGLTGFGNLSRVSYIQRIFNKGGVAPSAKECTKDGELAKIPYQSVYVFWAQLTSLSTRQLSPSLSSPAGTRPLFSFFGEGHQNYIYNGSTWYLKDATATLSSGPGQEVIGRHFFLSESDPKGGRPTWETFYPESTVTAKVVRSRVVDISSISWALLQATSSTGESHIFGSVLWVQRTSTRGGLPPSSSYPANTGDTFGSPYSSIYWFYVDDRNQKV